MNKITLIGNLTRDPESTVASGSSVCKFTIAVNRRFKKDGQPVTDFFNVNAWRQLADICSKNLAKGRKVAVIGELQPRTYEGRDGLTKFSLDVSADEVEFLSQKTEQADAPAEKTTPKNWLPEDGFKDLESEDVPF